MSQQSKSNKTPFYALATSSFISVTGDAMAMLAIPWFVLQTTGSAAQTGITAFFSMLPLIIGTLFGGVIADRIGYKRVSVLADTMSGLTIMLIPLLYQTVGLAFWQLLLLVFLGNLFDAPGQTARQSLIPELADMAGLSLERATAIMSGISRGTMLLGAPLAGFLVATIGTANVLWLDAMSFGISVIGITFFIPSVIPGTQEESPVPSQGWLEDFRAGFAYLQTDTLMLVLIVTIMFTNMLDAATGSVILPVYAERIFGQAEGAGLLGILYGVFGGAAVVGTLLMGLFGARFSRRRLFIGAFIIVSLRFFVLAIFPPFAFLVLLMILTGLAAGPINPILSTVGYERIPRTMRARVLGITSASVQLTMPLGVLITGYLLEWVGLQIVLVTFGVVYLSLTGGLLLYRKLHEMDTITVMGNSSPLTESAML